jgi:hypothetical protein
MSDPALRDLVVLTTSYRTTIVLTTLVVAGGAVAYGSIGPMSSTGIAVVHPAEVAPNGSVENLEISVSRVQTFIESKVMTQALEKGTVLDATVLRDQPPSSKPINLISLVVEAPTEEAADRALRIAIDELKAAQNPLYESEVERLKRNEKTYAEDVARLEKAALSKAGVEATHRAIVDLSETSRWLQSVRTHPLEVLVGPAVDPTNRTPRTVALGAIGFVLGICLGYLIAFVLAGLRAVRAAS